MNMSDDIRDAMKLIATLKKNKDKGGAITLDDLKNFLEVIW